MIKIHSICLIIDSDYPFAEHYARQRLLWKKYMNLDPEIKCYFIRLSETISEEIVVDKDTNTIYIKGEESYIPGVLIKTLKAMEYVYNTYDFDYLIRTNLSNFWNFKLYKKRFNTPISNLVEAAIVDYYNIPYPSGAAMVISKDVILKMLDKQNQYNYGLYDDIAIGLVLYDKNIPIQNVNNYRYQFVSPLSENEILSKIHSNIDKAYQIRAVSDRGAQDIFVLYNLYNLVYAKNRNHLL